MTANSLSSRQRMLAAIRREHPDHVPFSPYIGQGPWHEPPLFWHDQFERAQRMIALGLDPTIDIWLPDPQPHPDVQVRTWRQTKAGETLITKEYHTPAGTLRQIVRETDDWCSWQHGPWIPTTWGIEKRNHFGIDLFDDYGVSRRLEPWVKGPEDLPALRYLIRPLSGCGLDEWRMDSQRAMEVAGRLDLLTVARRLVVGDAFQWFCDIPWFLMQLHENPGFVREFLDLFQGWALKLTELALEVGVDVVQYRGWYEIPTFWGPRFWQEFLLPHIQAHGRRVHEDGKLLSYLLPEGQGAYTAALAGSDIDVLQGVDPQMLHGGDLRSLFATAGAAKAFWGGVNAEVTLESSDAGRIEAEVVEAVEALGGNGGLILSAFLFRSVPAAGINHMMQAWRKHGARPAT